LGAEFVDGDEGVVGAGDGECEAAAVGGEDGLAGDAAGLDEEGGFGIGGAGVAPKGAAAGPDDARAGGGGDGGGAIAEAAGRAAGETGQPDALSAAGDVAGGVGRVAARGAAAGVDNALAVTGKAEAADFETVVAGVAGGGLGLEVRGLGPPDVPGAAFAGDPGEAAAAGTGGELPGKRGREGLLDRQLRVSGAEREAQAGQTSPDRHVSG